MAALLNERMEIIMSSFGMVRKYRSMLPIRRAFHIDQSEILVNYLMLSSRIADMRRKPVYLERAMDAAYVWCRKVERLNINGRPMNEVNVLERIFLLQSTTLAEEVETQIGIKLPQGFR
jgi:hypothetical protein